MSGKQKECGYSWTSGGEIHTCSLHEGHTEAHICGFVFNPSDCCLERAEPTPPEGEAVTEQVKEFLTCPKCNHPRGFKAEFVWPSAIRCKCVECGEWSTREEWGLEPLPAPVVSTAAPGPEHGINNQTLDTRVVARLNKALHEAKAVAPESYKPAEGPELSELIAQQGIKPMKTGHELEIPGLSDEDMEGFTAATPVTVEAPGKCHPDCVTQIDYITKYSRPDLRGKPCDCGAATPKPIGDVEALLDELATSPDKTYCQRGRDELRAILSPLLAPAGPAGLCPKCKSDTFYIECNRCDYDFMGNVFDVFKSFEAQPPCSECATPSDKWYMEYQAAVARAVQAETECATLRKERDDARKSLESELHYTNCDKLHRERETKRHWQERAEAAEAQLSTLRDLDVNGIAETIAHEVCDETPKMHGNLPCWPGTHIIAEKVKQHLRAALAPTPEVAPKSCQIKGCVNKVAEMRHCIEHMPGNFPPETVAPKE